MELLLKDKDDQDKKTVEARMKLIERDNVTSTVYFRK